MIHRRGRCSPPFPQPSPDHPAPGGSMTSRTRHAGLVAGLALLLSVTPSWGLVGSVYFDVNDNTAAGQTLFNATFTGLANTGLGRRVLTSLTGGTGNTAIGASALFSNTSGNSNTATGFQALFSNFNGTWNTASGVLALSGNVSGGFNTAT